MIFKVSLSRGEERLWSENDTLIRGALNYLILFSIEVKSINGPNRENIQRMLVNRARSTGTFTSLHSIHFQHHRQIVLETRQMINHDKTIDGGRMIDHRLCLLLPCYI